MIKVCSQLKNHENILLGHKSLADSKAIIVYCPNKDRSCKDTMKRLIYEFNQTVVLHDIIFIIFTGSLVEYVVSSLLINIFMS